MTNSLNEREVIRFLRDAQQYLEHAVESVKAGEVRKVSPSMARARECMTEVGLRLKGKKSIGAKVAASCRFCGSSLDKDRATNSLCSECVYEGAAD